MIRLLRTNALHKDFIQLVAKLDAEVAILDGDDHEFFAPFNRIDTIKYAVVVFFNDRPVGCGSIREFDERTMEVKRMYTDPEFRGHGVATKVLEELEKWTLELGYNKCVLETGINLPNAIRLYQKSGYQLIPNYRQYEGVDTSRCFEKVLKL